MEDAIERGTVIIFVKEGKRVASYLDEYESVTSFKNHLRDRFGLTDANIQVIKNIPKCEIVGVNISHEDNAWADQIINSIVNK